MTGKPAIDGSNVMSREGFAKGLMEFYQGEVIGEVAFNRMLAQFTDPTHRYKVGVMLQLETETKARLRPPMIELGLDLAEAEASRRSGDELADALEGMSWGDAMVALREGLRPYVERYREIAAEAPAPYRELAESMVVHEESLFHFAELEIAGETEKSLDAIVAQLVFPLPPQ